MLAAFVPLLSGCSSWSGAAGGGQKAVLKITVPGGSARSLKAVAGLPSEVDRISIVVTGPGIIHPVSGEIPATGGTLTLTVPPGADRLVTGQAYSGTVIRMQGTALIAALSSGESKSVALTLNDLATISITNVPSTSVAAGASHSFGATVTAHATTGVTWSVNGIDGGNASIGTITSGGVYTAPSTLTSSPLSVTVEARSVEDDTLTAQVSFSVTASVLGNSPRFMYSIGYDRNIYLATIDDETGFVRQSGYFTLFDSNDSTVKIVQNPSGTRVYVLARNTVFTNEHDIYLYNVNATTGALSHVDEMRVPSSGQAVDMAISPDGQYLFIVDRGLGALRTFSLGADGTITGELAAAATGAAPSNLKISPSGNFVYLDDDIDKKIYAYRFDSATGAMSPLAGSPFGVSLTIDSRLTYDGKFLHTLDEDRSIHVYALNQTTGVPVEVTGSRLPLPGSSSAFSFRMDMSDSKMTMYLADELNGLLRSYSIDPASGALSLSGEADPLPIADSYNFIVNDPSGYFLYVGEADRVQMYSLDSSTGALAGVSPEGMFVSSVGNPRVPVVTRATAPVNYVPRFLYVTFNNSKLIYGFSIDTTTGALTDLPGSPFPGSSSALMDSPGYYVFTGDPSGKFLYTSGSYGPDSIVTAFSIDSITGALSEVGNYTSTGPTGSIRSLAVDPSGKYLFSSYNGSVRAWFINRTTGELTSAGPPVYVSGSHTLGKIVVASSGRALFVADDNGSSGGYVYTIPFEITSGVVTFDAPAITVASINPSGLKAIAVDYSGRFIVGTRLGIRPHFIGCLALAWPGAYSQIEVPGAQVNGLAFRPSWNGPLYTASGGEWYVYGYSYPSTAQDVNSLTAVPGSPFNPDLDYMGSYDIAIDPSGRFLYVTSKDRYTGLGNIHAMRLGAATGSLSSVLGSPFPAPGGQPSGLWITGTLE